MEQHKKSQIAKLKETNRCAAARMSTNKFFKQFMCCIQARTHTLFSLSSSLSFEHKLSFFRIFIQYEVMCINLKLTNEKHEQTLLHTENRPIALWWEEVATNSVVSSKERKRVVNCYYNHQISAFINRGCCQDTMNNGDRHKNKQSKKEVNCIARTKEKREWSQLKDQRQRTVSSHWMSKAKTEWKKRAAEELKQSSASCSFLWPFERFIIHFSPYQKDA